jgi:hypothetical protein
MFSRKKSVKRNKSVKKTYTNNKKNSNSFRSSLCRICCEKKTKKRVDKYINKPNYISINPPLDLFKNPYCKHGYNKKNSCNIETETYDNNSGVRYETYRDYLLQTTRILNHKIIIIGAGPSGLTTAYYLIKSGLSRKNIIILEKTNRLGGQSNTRNIDGKWIEAGTSYLTNAYKCITDIAFKTNVKIMDLNNQLYNKLEKNENTKVEISYMSSIILFKRYISVRKKQWLDKGQLYNPTLKDNYLTFKQWLQKYKLSEVLDNPLYIGAFHAQLYGWSDTVSAHNALQWMTPGLLYSVVSHVTRALPNGFENLWKKVAQYYSLDIRYKTEVLSVSKNRQTEKTEIRCKGNKEFICDDVFLCSDFSKYKHPLSNKIGTFNHTNVYSCRMYVDDIEKRFKFIRPYYVLNQKFHNEMEIVTCRNYGKNKKGKYIVVICSYLGNNKDLKKIRKHTKTELEKYGITKYKIIDDFIWKYNIRYSNEQFKKKIPIQLEEHEQIWYNSGVMSHWNVESIARHSIKKVREFLVYNRFSTSLIDNYKEKSLFDKVSTQNLFPQYKQKYGIHLDFLENFL